MRFLSEFLKGFRKGAHGFGNTIATLVNSSLLLVVYLVGVGLTAVFAKIVGKHFLDLEVSKKKETYWSDLNLRKKDIDEYYRQF